MRFSATATRLLAALALLPAASAQQPAPYTLHVYANRIQFATLVLSLDFHPLPPIPSRDFRVSLDDGRLFKPSSVRREGDDPINLAILLDATGDERELLDRFADALARLAPETLHPQDHVTLYAVDCTLVRSLDDAPATPDALRQGVANALAFPTLHGQKAKPSCGSKLRLWDITAHMVHDLSRLPGRNVILLVTSGVDRKSKLAWSDVARAADVHGISIFGMDNFYNTRSLPSFSRDPIAGSYSMSSLSAAGSADELRSLCERNGGIVLSALPKSLGTDLQSFIGLLRSRYIVEFPRGDASEPGDHSINITVGRSDVFIAITGSSFPTPDPSLLKDPTTVPSAPSQATYGTHRPHN